MGIDHIEEVNKNIDEIEHIEKFNPFHDSLGRFSSSQGMKTYSANPKTKAGQMAISRSTAAGYGAVMNVHRESKGENIRQNDNWVRSGQKPNKSQLARAQANAPTSVAQARLNAHTNRVKGTMGATETANAKHPRPAKQAQPAQQNQSRQGALNAARAAAARNATAQQAQTQQNQANQNAKTIHLKQKMRSGSVLEADYDQSTTAGALNKEFKGTVQKGKDLTKSFDVAKLKATDDYNGQSRYTNHVADQQGFNAPAKKVSQAEFDKLAKACGDEFYRTVGPGTLYGKSMTAQDFKNAYTSANDLTMNGPSGRVYGDGHYTASAAMNAGRRNTYTARDAQVAKRESQWYGDGQTTLKMTWLSKPNIVTERKLTNEWNKLSVAERAKFGNHKNTYACAKGYDAIYTSTSNYMVVFNRSKLAILDD